MAEQAQNPNLMSKKAMETMASTSGVSGETVHEIFTKVNNLFCIYYNKYREKIDVVVGYPVIFAEVSDATYLSLKL